MKGKTILVKDFYGQITAYGTIFDDWKEVKKTLQPAAVDKRNLFDFSAVSKFEGSNSHIIVAGKSPEFLKDPYKVQQNARLQLAAAKPDLGPGPEPASAPHLPLNLVPTGMQPTSAI